MLPIDAIRGCNPLVPKLPSYLFKDDLISYSDKYDIQLKQNLSIKFQTENVALFSGSVYAIETILQLQYDNVYIVEGDFYINALLAKFYNQNFILIPNNNVEVFIENIIPDLVNKKCLFLLPFVRGFDGGLADYKKLALLSRELYKISPKSCMVLDGAYLEYAKIAQNEINKVIQEPNIMFIGTFSKAYGIPGYRVGYLLYKINYVNLFKMPYNLPIISAKLANFLLLDNKFLIKSIYHNDKEKEFLCKSNKRLINTKGNRVLYLTPKMKELMEYLKLEQIHVRNLRYNNSLGISYSIGKRKQNKYFLDKLNFWEINE